MAIDAAAARRAVRARHAHHRPAHRPRAHPGHPLTEGAAEVCGGVLRGLGADAEAWFADEGIEPTRRVPRRVVDLRYVGQNYELPVPLRDGPVDAAAVDALRHDFHAAHERMYGYAAPGDTVEAVTFRVEAIGTVDVSAADPEPLGKEDPAAALAGHRDVYLPEHGGRTRVPVYDRDLLRPGHRMPGPALVDQYDTTTLVPPGDTAQVDGHHNIVITIGAPA
ncbi:MAG: hypothetical protein GEV11_24175 [Streptosporangiales bacterium]|nr:hypothetical protein [Streptosporangiales bacterium]